MRMTGFCPAISLIFLLIVLLTSHIDAQNFRKALSSQCNVEGDTDYCSEGKMYTTYTNSPAVSTNKKAKHLKAHLTLNGFQKGEDGGGPSECDGKFHSDDTRIVALSSEWFNHKKRCFKSIIIHGNGRSVKAKVVDECDTSRGCPHNIVDASRAVWKALGVPKSQWGGLDITWSDA